MAPPPPSERNTARGGHLTKPSRPARRQLPFVPTWVETQRMPLRTSCRHARAHFELRNHTHVRSGQLGRRRGRSNTRARRHWAEAHHVASVTIATITTITIVSIEAICAAAVARHPAPVIVHQDRQADEAGHRDRDEHAERDHQLPRRHRGQRRRTRCAISTPTVDAIHIAATCPIPTSCPFDAGSCCAGAAVTEMSRRAALATI